MLTVRHMVSADVEYGDVALEHTAVCFPFDFEVGPADSEGGDIFHVTVATPAGLANARASSNVISDRNLLLFHDFTWAALETAVHDIVRRCAHDDWSHACTLLQRYFRWEYEGMDYR